MEEEFCPDSMSKLGRGVELCSENLSLMFKLYSLVCCPLRVKDLATVDLKKGLCVNCSTCRWPPKTWTRRSSLGCKVLYYAHIEIVAAFFAVEISHLLVIAS